MIAVMLGALGVVSPGCGGGSEADAGGGPDAGRDAAPEGGAGDASPDAPGPADAGRDAPGADAGPARDPLDFLERPSTRALFLWNEAPTTRALLEDADGEQDALFSFLAAPHDMPARAITRLYFEARAKTSPDKYAELFTVTYDPLLEPSEQPALRTFVRRASERGIAVEYLDGQAIWLATDDNADAAIDVCEDVVTFNETTDDPAERLSGVHLDIEPHTVQSGPYAGEWWEDRLPNGYNADWTARYQRILSECRAALDDFEAATGEPLTLSVDVGADYGHYNEPLREWLNAPGAPVDYLTIMNYYDNRENAEGDPSYFYGDDDGSTVVGGVIENLMHFDHVPLVFAMETGPESIAPDPSSFHQEGYERMYGVTDELVRDYGDRNVVGVAYHHYAPDSYRDLDP